MIIKQTAWGYNPTSGPSCFSTTAPFMVPEVNEPSKAFPDNSDPTFVFIDFFGDPGRGAITSCVDVYGVDGWLVSEVK
jgi:hypothetical protein